MLLVHTCFLLRIVMYYPKGTISESPGRVDLQNNIGAHKQSPIPLQELPTRLSIRMQFLCGFLIVYNQYPKAQNSPKALYKMVFAPKGLKT